MASFGKFLQNLAMGVVAVIACGLVLAFALPWIADNAVTNWSKVEFPAAAQTTQADEARAPAPPAEAQPGPPRHAASDEGTDEAVFRQERRSHHESGGSSMTGGGSEQSRISAGRVAQTAHCDMDEEFCWRFPSRFGRDQETAHEIIRFIQSEIRNPRGREVPEQLIRWQFTDTVPPSGATPLAGGGEVVWVENANFQH